MIIKILLLNVLCWGNITSLMKAKTSAQVEEIHSRHQKETILKQRCQIEIQQNWIPVSCYGWVELVSISKNTRLQWFSYFDRQCLSSLEKKPPLPAKKAIQSLPVGKCLESVQKYHLDSQYRLGSGSSVEQMARSMEIGNEIVNTLEHAPAKEHNDQQLQYRRALGRGLN